ncbi:protein SMAX1-LIKE 4-like [Diospyros lotus]|uniref:protein SMAX1-LIKE 4-like n=1 Tax=Diospyros lotus TaxID=55363 RepID=UPI00224CBE54|nr:protein SMAX1-LIKE 4-like [Diospyros lotus]
MRSGVCTVQQTFSAEAASVLKHSLSLARRRGHAQLTPLHVAATLLSPRASILKRACLKSQPHQTSHPFHCKALELCFNVALNRLPTTPGSLLHGQPSLSNALIAALKRAQAHQRRGFLEQQQQQQQPPLLAVKVELDQLILSILDDPSVSRVMREAGFSSTAVKNNLEDSSSPSVFHCYGSSGGVYSSPPSPPENQREIINPMSFWQTHFLAFNSDQNPLLSSPQKKLPSINNPSIHSTNSLKQETKLIFEVLLKKRRRNTVIVGDSAALTETLAVQVMDSIEKGDVPDELKSTRVIRFELKSVPLRFMKREEVKLHLSDLKRKVDSLASGGIRGVMIYTGDLKWTVEEETGVGYNPVDHLIEDIGRLLSEHNSNSNTTKVWLMATANYQTYMKCQMKQPSLEIQWSLQAVSVPSAGLGLSLQATSAHDYGNPSELPETKPFAGKEDQGRPSFLFHGQGLSGKSYQPCALNPWWANQKPTSPEMNSICFGHSPSKTSQTTSSLPRFRRQQSCHIEFSFSNESSKPQSVEPNLDSLKNTDVKITLALGNSPDSVSGELVEIRKSEISKQLEENVPWQLEAIPGIVQALVESRPTEKGTWLMIRGNDSVGSRRLARCIAESVFGTAEFLLCMNMREREGKMISECTETLERAFRDGEKYVFLVENVDLANTRFLKFLGDSFQTGNFPFQAIFILTQDESTSCRCGKDTASVIQINLEVEEMERSQSHSKRKADWDLSNKAKSPRIHDENESASSIDLNIKAEDFSPVSSDLTGETGRDLQVSCGFLEQIKNRFDFSRDSAQDRLIKEELLGKIKRSFEEVSGSFCSFDVEEKLTEELLAGAGSFLNAQFEKWLRDVFQRNLLTVKIGGKRSLRLCLGRERGKDQLENSGFLGSNLPQTIQVSFVE